MNTIPRVEVISQGYKVVHRQDPVVLYTKNLGDEMACTILSYETGMAALLRQVDITKLPEIMQSLNPDNLQLSDLFKVTLVRAADHNDATEKYRSEFITALTTWDKVTSVNHMVTCNNIQEYNYDSFEFDCSHGLVAPLDQGAIDCYDGCMMPST